MQKEVVTEQYRQAKAQLKELNRQANGTPKREWTVTKAKKTPDMQLLEELYHVLASHLDYEGNEDRFNENDIRVITRFLDVMEPDEEESDRDAI